MANSAAGDARDFNTQIIEEFRANQGRVDAEFLEGLPVILIHHVGAASRTERVTPLACYPWYFNLKAHPRITVELGTETFTVLAEELDGSARAALWASMVARAPSLGVAQAKTARQMPVFRLIRQDVATGDTGAGGASMARSTPPPGAGPCETALPTSESGVRLLKYFDNG